jgi:hypothetical protein
MSMTLQELHTKFPGVHALFVDSPEFTPPRPGDITGDLVHFLRARGFNVLISHTPPPSKRSRKMVLYGVVLIIHGRTIDLEDRWFATYDEAQEHVLDYALDMFSEELKIIA